MRLYVVRHAVAESRDAVRHPRDAKRPLTSEGRTQARRVARGLKRLKVRPDVILTSPYVRAIQTAEQLRNVLGVKIPMHECVALRSEARPHEASLALKPYGGHERLILVGHEPHLSGWLAELVAGHRGLHCLIKKGGVACVEIDHVPPPVGSATLLWLLTPRQLTYIGKA